MKFILLIICLIVLTATDKKNKPNKGAAPEKSRKETTLKSNGQAWHSNGQLAWNEGNGWHENGQLAWNGQDKNGWHKDGKLAWNGKDQNAWHNNGQLAWNGKSKTAWHSSGKLAWDIDKGWHNNGQLAGDHLEIILGSGFNLYIDKSGVKLFVAGKLFTP